MKSAATSVPAYLAGLPPDRRASIEAVRAVILAHLDPAYVEGMQYGMIAYSVPHSVFPAGYHCDPSQPLMFAALASQKNHMVIYLMSVYGDEACERWFRESWAKSGKKLDMGKACVRFKRREDVALEVIGAAVQRTPADRYVARYLQTLAKSKSRSPAGKEKTAPAARKPAKKKAA